MSWLEENPNCERTYASFRLAGDGLVAFEVTRRLGIDPEFAAERGEVRHEGQGRPITQRTGVWLIRSENALDTTSLERHLLFLLQRLEPASAELEEVVERQRLEADFFCYWRSATGHGGPEISPDTLRRVAKVGATLAFDFYGPFEDADGDK